MAAVAQAWPGGLASPAGTGSNDPARSRPVKRSSATPDRRARLLVVEDEAIIAWQLEILLGDLGYDVVGTALNAREAIRLADETDPDAILMDVRLGPGEDGITAAGEILRHRIVPIVFCTAFADDESTAERVRALGASVVAKPVEPATLHAALRRALDRDDA